MRSVLYLFILVAALTLVCMTMCGCESKASPQAQQTIQQNDDQAAVDAAKIAADAKVASEKAKADAAAAAADPVRHPFVATTNVVKAAQKPLGFIATVAFLAAAVGVGLYFTKLSWLSTILVPVGGAVAAFCYFGVIALPFFPWVSLGLAGLFFALALYELIHNKGSVPKTVQSVEADLGVKTPTPSTVVPTPMQLIHA